MRKQQIIYTSPLDALIAVAKRLSLYETQHNMSSEDFFNCYSQGEISDDTIFVEWANDYRHYFGLRQELEKQLQEVSYGSVCGFKFSVKTKSGGDVGNIGWFS